MRPRALLAQALPPAAALHASEKDDVGSNDYDEGDEAPTEGVRSSDDSDGGGSADGAVRRDSGRRRSASAAAVPRRHADATETSRPRANAVQPTECV